MKREKDTITMGVDEARGLVSIVEALWDNKREGLCCGRMTPFNDLKKLTKEK